METVNIVSVTYTDKKKDGTPILSKFGKVSYKVGLKTKEYEGYINGFLPFAPDKWEGTTQSLEITDDPKWGKQFKLPPKAGAGLTEQDKTLLKQTYDMASASNTNALRVVALIQELARELKNAGVIGATNSDGSKVPDFNHGNYSPIGNNSSNGNHSTKATLPPIDEYEEEFRASDIPF